MRKLTAKQKRMLKEAMTKYFNDHKEYPINVFDLPNYLEIDAVNFCELFWQNSNCFMRDEALKLIHAK